MPSKSSVYLKTSQTYLRFCAKGTSDKTVSPAKRAKDAKVGFDKKQLGWVGLCELSGLGAISFIKLVLFNQSMVRI